jgi:uncharacterized protein
MSSSAIDAWAQMPLPNARQMLPEAVRLFEKSGTAQYLDRTLTVDEVVSAMDAAQIEKVMLCAWCGPRGWLFTNDQVAGIVRQRPLGFKALSIVPWLWNLPPNDKHYFPLYAPRSSSEFHSARRWDTRVR